MQTIFINPSEVLEAIKPILGKKRYSHKKPFVVTMGAVTKEANEGKLFITYGTTCAGVPCKGKWSLESVEINGPYFRDILKTYSNEELIQISKKDFHIEINCGGSTVKIKRLDSRAVEKELLELRKAKLDAEIKENDGYFGRQGLYHGQRRVRAKWEFYSKWVLSPDETDLISALGVNKFDSDVNPVDLRNRFGLEIRTELAPVRTAISEGDSLEVIRTDEWGEGAKEYIDKRTWYQKIDFEDWKHWPFYIAFFPVILVKLLMDKLSYRSQKVFGNIFFMSTLIIFSLFLAKTEGDLGFFGLLFSLYLALPSVAAMFQAHIGADKWPF